MLGGKNYFFLHNLFIDKGNVLFYRRKVVSRKPFAESLRFAAAGDRAYQH